MASRMMRRRRRLRGFEARSARATIVGVALALALAGCASGEAPEPESMQAAAADAGASDGDLSWSSHDHASHDHSALDASRQDVPPPPPLRTGERYLDVAMPTAYTPSAPYGEGTDDYRCFLLDPELARDSWITGVDVQPGATEIVHHVILFRVPPGEVAAAEAQDDAEDGPGWTCFSGTGMGGGGVGDLDRAPWLGAWAPGGTESALDEDIGVPVEAGSRIVMQVHYNLLAGDDPDRSATRLRIAKGSKDLEALETMLLPAPVELPCRLGKTGPLCDRDAAIDDVAERFGERSRFTVNGLHVLCGDDPVGSTQSCTRTIDEPVTVRRAAGHMHLLGRSISIEANPGTPRAKMLLDIPIWNFDDQASKPTPKVRLRAGDEVKVTCTWDQGLRDLVPALQGIPERYVVWGEGTTDEMCLGTLQITEG